VLLGIGVNTLRRRIATGQVQAEQIERPQGQIWRVYLDVQHPPSQQSAQPPEQEAVGGSQQPPTQLAQADAISTLVQTTVAAVLGPLVAEVAASRQTIERQAEQIADLREERGRHTAELERAASTVVALGAENEALRASHSPVASNPAPVVPAASTDAPSPHQINPGALVPWLFTALALFGGGRAVAADMSPEALYAAAAVVAVVVVAYVIWKRRGRGSGGGS
jgi:hypothetical protein